MNLYLITLGTLRRAIVGLYVGIRVSGAEDGQRAWIWGSGSRVQGLGLRIPGLGVQGLGFRGQDATTMSLGAYRATRKPETDTVPEIPTSQIPACGF